MSAGDADAARGVDASSEDDDDRLSLVTNRGLLAVVALMGVAAWQGLTAIVLLAALVTAVGLVGRAWSAMSLIGVGSERRLSHSRAFAGDSVELSLSVENGKLLPLSWLRLEEKLPSNRAARAARPRGSSSIRV